MTGSLGRGRRTYRLTIGVTLTVLVILALSCLAWMVGGDDDPDPPVAAEPTVSPSPAPAAPELSWSPVGPRVVVPDVVGRNAAVAAQQLGALGFTNVLCTTPDDDDGFRPTAEWTVTGQLEAAGTTMTAGNGPFYLRCAPAR
ncbi:PASTA domain-containing protein [Virgisporangium aurantiacum]|uniref:PASTA domain-containing protein n=1 Tax=Virgisporangium aurantiacum TaxID=175570 RepID=UPI00194DE239|nr:hypothetical protein [Virgisporangium aurantiacum]